jgi:hypothetical protein
MQAIRLESVMNKSILTGYVSEIDKLLEDFDKNNPSLSTSQRKECEKHRRIVLLRDTINKSENKSNLWEGF